ncbi:MAG: Ig-like domain-containing protein [Acidobacteriota bacterium]
MKRFFYFLSVVSILFLLSCKTPVSLKVEPKEVVLFDKDATVSLKIQALDKNGEEVKKVKYEFVSQNSSVANIDNTGKITAVGSGETAVEIRTKKISEVVPVKVIIADVLKMEFSIPGVFDVQGPEKSVYKLLVTAKNEKGQDIDVSLLKFTSSDNNVATVNEKGELTLLNDGKTVITAQLGKKKATLEVPVTILRPSAVKVDSPRFSINVGETTYLPFSVISTKGTTLIDFPVKVEFEKDGIATADEVGKVTGISKGTTKVTIYAGDSSNTLTLTVK